MHRLSIRFRTLKQIRRTNRERGGIAVEAGLTLPILSMVVLVGIMFGRVLTTRHDLANAASYAARSAAVSGQTNLAAIQANARQIIQQRMGAELSRCSSLNVTPRVSPSGYTNVQQIEIQVTCVLAPIFGSSIFSPMMPDQVSVTAAMPVATPRAQ